MHKRTWALAAESTGLTAFKPRTEYRLRQLAARAGITRGELIEIPDQCSWLDQDSFDLIQVDLVGPPVVQPCGSRRLVVGHLLGNLQFAAVP